MMAVICQPCSPTWPSSASGGGAPGNISAWRRYSASTARRFRLLRNALDCCPNTMFSAAVKLGRSGSSWCTTPIPARSASRGPPNRTSPRPSIQMPPDVGCSRAQRTLINVLLPAPWRPGARAPCRRRARGRRPAARRSRADRPCRPPHGQRCRSASLPSRHGDLLPADLRLTWRRYRASALD